MDPELFERLLFRGESDALDFKVDQYSFEGATDNEKSQLLKDILAFANSWRDTDAYILIGVAEVIGDKAKVDGISNSKSLADHALQQFVTAKVQHPIRFSYAELRIEGKLCGVIHIPRQDQDAPFYATKDYGTVEANVVYVRRGSSNGIAKPDEIAKMGKRAQIRELPRFMVFAEPTVIGLATTAPMLVLKAWLRNKGSKTAYEIIEELPIGEFEIDRKSWSPVRRDGVLRWASIRELHPEDKLLLFSDVIKEVRFAVDIGDGDLDRVKFNGKIARYDGGPIDARVTILSKDQPPVIFHLSFSQAEIKALTRKEFLPLAQP